MVGWVPLSSRGLEEGTPESGKQGGQKCPHGPLLLFRLLSLAFFTLCTENSPSQTHSLQQGGFTDSALNAEERVVYSHSL